MSSPQLGSLFITYKAESLTSKTKTLSVTPAFSPHVTEYTGHVPFEVHSCEVLAMPKKTVQLGPSPLNRQAPSVSVSGAADLRRGDNTVTVSVEHGTSLTTYTVHIHRDAHPQDVRNRRIACVLALGSLAIAAAARAGVRAATTALPATLVALPTALGLAVCRRKETRPLPVVDGPASEARFVSRFSNVRG